MTTSPVFVLVHGAWHGGWCWRDVRSLLEAAGARVFTPTLTGLADKAHLRAPAPSLSTHIQDVVNLIEWEELSDIVLCGHSYAGMVVTGVADRLKGRLRHVVYLDAAVPQDAQSMITQGEPLAADVLAARAAQLRALAPDGVWMAPLPPEALGVPQDHPAYAWVARRLTPHPLPSWEEPIRLTAAGSNGLPRTYVLCARPLLAGASFGWHAARLRQDRSWRVAEIATGHDAMVTAPRETAALLLAALS